MINSEVRGRFVWLMLIVAALLVLRLPLVWRQVGGMDEQWFAVPGYTVATEGIPRIPFVPARNPEGVFYKADELLFALPPGLFYAQAPFFWVLPAGYRTARLPSVLAAVAAICLVYALGRRFYDDGGRAGLIAAGLYSLSRILYFPAMTARPDMLCGTIGLLAVLTTWQWTRSGRRGQLVVSGLLLGLGMLTHPFAIVYCLQIGGWVLLRRQTLRGRCVSFGLVTGCALLTFALWTPLILMHPEAFQRQFFNNVLDPSGPGLLTRLVYPWPYLWYQLQLLYEHAGAWQTVLMLAGLVSATLLDGRRSARQPHLLLALAWSGLYLLAACQGVHPTKGYWCYTGAFLFLCCGRVLVAACDRLSGGEARTSRWVTAGAVLLAAAVIVPGSGLRTWVAHVRHWSDVDYNGPRFVRHLLEELPREGHYLVDPAFVFDFYLAGRDVILAADTADYYLIPPAEYPYDYLVVTHQGLEDGWPEQLNGRRIATYGDADDVFSNYAAVYVPGTSSTRSASGRATRGASRLLR